MTLKTLFAIPIAVILLVTLALALMLAGQGWTGQARGKAAVEAVEGMRLLLLLQADLRSERVATNFALGAPYPMSEAVRARMDGVRREVDQRIATIIARLRANAKDGNTTLPEPYLATVMVRLGMARAAAGQLLSRPQNERTFFALNAVQPSMVWASQALDRPFERVSLAIIAADPGLSGLLIEQRLATSLRDHVGMIAGVMIPRVNNREALTAGDRERIRVLVAQAEYLIQLLRETIETVGGTGLMRETMAGLQSPDTGRVFRRLTELPGIGALSVRDDNDLLLPQHILVPWGEQVDTMRAAIADATVARVTLLQDTGERKFGLFMVAFGFVIVAVLESVVLLSQRVVRPLAELGLAITRIAAGDRSIAVRLQTGAREITEMVTAVETLRQAALVADATALRHRLAARHRLEMLREALGIVQTVREPARALERGVARLSEGIDATIAFVTNAAAVPPATLGVAANAVRVGLAEMRDSAAALDATFAAADSAQTEDRPEAEFLAHILAVQAQVGRRDNAVRRFVQPSLVALRDAACSTGGNPGPVLRDLVSDQFQRIEETVVAVAAMLASVARAAAIVRDLPLDETPMAA